MCAQKDFCSQCESNTVRNWSNGFTHTISVFGDTAQRCAAINRRAQKLIEMFSNGDQEFLFWPEWVHVTRSAKFATNVSVARLKSVMQPSIPSPGRGASRQRKHKYQVRLREWNWNVEVINRLKNAVGHCEHQNSAVLSMAA
jgi:hypothetical protein